MKTNWRLSRGALPFLFAAAFCGAAAAQNLPPLTHPDNSQPPLPERTYSVQLVDEGRPDSPLRATGEISFHEELFQNAVRFRWKMDVSYINVSPKEIRASEVEIDATPERGGGFVHLDHEDYFFRPESAFLPGAQQVLRLDDSPTAVVPYDGSKQQPIISRVTFKVRFVEFSDGTFYGGGKWGESLHDSRLATVARFRQLKQAYETGGDAALRSVLNEALARKDNLKPTEERLGLLKMTLDDEGPQSLIARINESLEVAKRRGIKTD